MSILQTIIMSRLSIAIIVVMFSAGTALAENEGQDDLDKATELKLTAGTLGDLAEVIRLAESALEKGLDQDNTQFAESLLTATLIQRGMAMSAAIFKSSPPDARWPQFRHVALEDLEKAVKLNPKQPQALLLIARLNMLPEGDAKRAAEAVDKTIELLADDPEQRARALVLRAGIEDDPAKQLADLDLAHQIAPDNTAVMLLRAGIYHELDQPDKAIAELEELRRLKPKNPLVLMQLGMAYSVEKKSQQAIEAYSAMLVEAPDAWPALRGRGDAMLNLGRQVEAVADYEKVLKLRPKDAGTMNNLAWVLATSPDEKLRDGRRAIEMATEACELTEYKQAHILSTLAAAYAETGDFDSAVKWVEKGLEVGSEDESLKEPLEKELEGYRDGKPWRELLAP